jgi:hypothetical protein
VTTAAVALFVFLACLIGFFALIAWGLAGQAGEELERKRARRSS